MKLSVVIPAYNEERLLPRCLDALIKQSRLADEIIIVDNNSTDRTIEIAQSYDVSILYQARQGIGYASQAGYDAATGDIIVRCDADTIAPIDWLERIEATFTDRSTDVVAVTGPGKFYDINPLVGAVMQLTYMHAYFVLVGSAMAQYPLFGSNFAMKRSVWQQINDDTHLDRNDIHDDIDLTYHLMEYGRIAYDRSLLVGISSRPLFQVKGMHVRMLRGMTSLVIHWPAAAPWRLYRRHIRNRLNL